MRKIKKSNSRTNQTVLAFACPCGECRRYNECRCRQEGYESASWNVIYGQKMNRGNGGSIVGGGG